MSKRKQFTPEQKVAIVRRHLVEKVAVSDLCDELGMHANQYYNWQKQLFENAAPAFARRPNKANEKRRQNAAETNIWRETRTGIGYFDPDPKHAKFQLARSTLLQMMVSPQIIHVV